MQNINYPEISADLLHTFVVVFEEKSIAKAADRLDQNPSTLSHRIERLRGILGDELFVRAGRGIVPTLFAEEAIGDARAALASIRSMSKHRNFDPSKLNEEFSIGTTDIERSTFILDAYKEILKIAPNVRFRFVWESYADCKSLRRRDVDFIISPIIESEDTDIRRRLLYRDRAVCYFDPKQRNAPSDLSTYLASRHIRVMFSQDDVSLTDIALKANGHSRTVAVTMPSISEVPKLMTGTDLTITMPSRLSETVFSEFDFCPPPFPMNDMSFYLFWHDLTNNSPMHIWLRNQLFNYVDKRPALKSTPQLNE